MKLAIEVDGNSHYMEGAYDNDVRRQINLEYLGVHFLRFSEADVRKDMPNVMITVAAKVEELKQAEQ